MRPNGKHVALVFAAFFVGGLLLAPAPVLGRDTKGFANAAVHAKYGVQTITPRSGRPYLRRGPKFAADQAKFDGYTWIKGHMVKGQNYRRAHLRSVGKGWDRVDFFGGVHISEASRQIASRAQQTGRLTMGLFNGTVVYARPGDTPKQAQGRWQARMDQKSAKDRVKADAREARWQVKRAKLLSGLGKPLVSTPPSGMKLDRRGRIEKSSFFNDNSFDLNLITPQQLRQLPKGTVLHSIGGRQSVVGVDYIDGDTRGGFLAYGFRAN
jgi:hypothetical protein